MTTLLAAALVLVAWCLLPLPLAVAVGRSFRAGEVDRGFDAEVRRPRYDAAGA